MGYIFIPFLTCTRCTKLQKTSGNNKNYGFVKTKRYPQ